MIPLKDDQPTRNTPYVNYFLIAANVVVWLFEVSLPAPVLSQFMSTFGIVPATLLANVHQYGVVSAAPLPIFTAMFLHASWLHILANMWVLWIFGDNIEDYLGSFRYLLFYLLSGIAASLLHIAFNSNSTLPSVGASGAIAGVMGAYFLLYPSGRVLTLVPFLFVFFVWLPAWIVLGYWFLVQFLSGAATSITAASSTQRGGVAFWAHVGGFAAGLALIKLIPARAPRYRLYSRQ
jgi:membrane associated rhomboid family serine protease